MVNHRVSILSLTAASTGLTLTAARTVIFTELYWTPALLLQAEDRVHRIGQKKEVRIYYVLAHDTLDDLIWPLIGEKLEVVGSALNGKESRMDFSNDVNASSGLAISAARVDAGKRIVISPIQQKPTQKKVGELGRIQEELRQHVHGRAISDKERLLARWKVHL